MKAVLIGKASFKDPDIIPASQLYPFFSHRAVLRRELGLEVQHIHAHTFAEIEQVTDGLSADVFFIRPAWQESPSEAERVMAKLRRHNPTAKIIFIDPFDQTSSRFFNVLPYVDRLLKYQRLKDVSTYTKALVGGTFLTDRLTQELGYDLNHWHVGSDVPSGYESRIDTGWYLSLIPRFKRELFHRPLPWERRSRQKDIDIFCHVSYGPRNNLEWYGQHRMAAIELLKPLASTYRLAVSGEYTGERAVSTRQYFNEIKRSRIAFSPFGWGEITLRDYEAVCYDCL
ncbi:hypothetical protein [Thermocoleostomius sinensis]|uniref:Glycosyltransferase family 1 protein n=1 Tax=Thermocoleostomius sinensis A174 TaxID=2016057 RepID=A0A9E8ZHI3_9CYAN|nr:hypothetical protein [Thermocoleostomius sinensis]WAL61305.1 hypothetical protein OXH18_04720 [Thermocoleostomius sinensis A174]